MTFSKTGLDGVFTVEIEPRPDARGFFARTWCGEEFARAGLDTYVAQCSISFNKHKGTLRGMHYQAAPFAETKLVRCTQGAIFDVVIDLRPASPTYQKWTAAELNATNRTMMYVPQGCAHGFLTLAEDTEVSYQMSQFYSEASARGVRWDDPTFGIAWPTAVVVISDRDRTYPNFQE
jgi:dTDP-4-dehydrorhamnose 3,5-epimerase